jgi:uncharacterized membrane protein YqiK
MDLVLHNGYEMVSAQKIVQYAQVVYTEGCECRGMALRKAVLNVVDFCRATTEVAQAALKQVVDQQERSALLAGREQVNQQFQALIEQQTAAWGIQINQVRVALN